MDDERKPENQPLPGSVSEQNGEEQPGSGGGAGESTTSQDEHGKTSDRDDDSGGEASEGSQSTGDPHSAG